MFYLTNSNLPNNIIVCILIFFVYIVSTRKKNTLCIINKNYDFIHGTTPSTIVSKQNNLFLLPSTFP